MIEFEISTGNMARSNAMPRNERWRRYTVLLRELKCVLWPVAQAPMQAPVQAVGVKRPAPDGFSGGSSHKGAKV